MHFKDNNYKNISVDNLYWSKYRKGDIHYEESLKKKRKGENSKAVSKRRRKIKEIAVEYKGGKCVFLWLQPMYRSIRISSFKS